MRSNIRKTSLIALQVFLVILVISLAFNFAFTPKITTDYSNDGSTLSPEDYINSLDNGGGGGGGGSTPINPNNPSGSGNDFDVQEYFEKTGQDIRIQNNTDTTPEIEINAPSQNSNLVYYNLTISDVYTDTGGFIMLDDNWYGNFLQWRVVSNETEGFAYYFNVTEATENGIIPYVFIDSFSFGLVNLTDAPNGFNFTVFILSETTDGSQKPNATGWHYQETFTAPPKGLWGEYVPFDGYNGSSISGDRIVLEAGNYYIGIIKADVNQVDFAWIAEPDSFADDDGKTYYTGDHTKQPPETIAWIEEPVDMTFMYYYSDVAVTEEFDMEVIPSGDFMGNSTAILAGNATYYGANKSLSPWDGLAIWQTNETNPEIPPGNDGTFYFDIKHKGFPDIFHMKMDYTLYCEFSDGSSQTIYSTYSVTSGNNVTWTLDYSISVPSGLDANLKIMDIPSDWTLTSVKSPDGSEKISTAILENANLTITSISQSGTWRIYFTSHNYVNEVYSQEYSEAGYFNQTTFYSSDEMRVNAYIENLSGSVGGGTATLTVLKPDSTDVAHTKTSGADSNGRITFSDWEVPYNEPTGNYRLQVLWNNGTEVGFLDTIVKINSESLDGGESSQESGEAKNYLTVNADYEGILERGHSLDIQINVTRWGNVVEGLNITLKFLDETYTITVYDEVESNELQVNQMGAVSTFQEGSYFDVTETEGIYDIQIETANLTPGSYTFEIYASKEGFEDTGSVFDFTVERMSVSTFFVAYSPKVVTFNPLPSLSVAILSIAFIMVINSLLFSPVDAEKFIDLYVYTNTGLGIDHVSFGSFETDEALMTGALAGISSLIAEATQTKTPPKVIEKEEFTIIIEYGEFIAASLFAKVKARSFAHRKISHDLRMLVKDFESENKDALEHWTGDLSKIEPLSKYIISGFRLKPSMYLTDLKYEYGVLNYEKKNLFNAFLLLVDAFKSYLENKNIEKANQAFFLLEEILRKLVNYAPFTIIRPFANFMDTQTNRSLKFALMRLISKYIELFRHSKISIL
ncbi:hypothetical protein [Candidatus Borrarchaeum sp.]|uniref:hypothetical protein n=1 Tax=Candidatus Borrarchaeum sp. TaxID=2846742 RepID=UPI00257DB866|nr:hypothetical protein [Candidatus Borrarchaeum sp.]